MLRIHTWLSRYAPTSSRRRVTTASNRRHAFHVETQQAVSTITNEDLAPASDVSFSVSTDWNSGFTGEVRLCNSSASALANWRLAFDFDGNITSIWNGQIVSHVGNRYVVKSADYNSTIAAGATANFGFVGSRASAAVVPTNFVLNGGSVDGRSTAINKTRAVGSIAST